MFPLVFNVTMLPLHRTQIARLCFAAKSVDVSLHLSEVLPESSKILGFLKL